MNTFGKEKRLLTKNDYDYVFQKAHKVSSSDFLFLYRDNKIGFARLGLALSKKMIAKAHDRNRLKRLLRETFRIQVDLPAVDLIVLARKGVGTKKSSDLRVSLEQSWNKLKLTKFVCVE